MAVPTSRGTRPAAAVVGALVAEIETELDPLVAAIGERIREEIPDFRRLPADALAGAIRGNVSRALSALRDVRPPTDAELEQAAAIGRERAEQGLTVDAVLHAYRISITAVWSRFGELARERGADVGERARVLRDAVAVGRRGDGHRREAAHREVELEQAREEQQRRDAFVFALLTGTLDAAELRLQSATFGLDADRDYIAVPRARHRRRRAAAPRGDGARGRRRAGHRPRPRLRRHRRAPAVGQAGRRLRPRPAGAAGVAAGRVRVRQPRAPDRGRVRAGGRVLARRPLDPSRDPRRRGARRRVRRALPRAARRASAGWAPSSRRRCARGSTRRCGSRTPPGRCTSIPNTLRHRLRRFEEATGATLRDPRDLVELWWALERRRLAG